MSEHFTAKLLPCFSAARGVPCEWDEFLIAYLIAERSLYLIERIDPETGAPISYCLTIFVSDALEATYVEPTIRRALAKLDREDQRSMKKAMKREARILRK